MKLHDFQEFHPHTHTHTLVFESLSRKNREIEQ